MNPLLLGHSGTTPETSRNALSTGQGTNEYDSQNDPHPEAGLFHGQMTQNSGPEDGHDSEHHAKTLSFGGCIFKCLNLKQNVLLMNELRRNFDSICF